MMKSLGYSLTDEEIKDMIAEADTDDKGAIDFPEFLTMMIRKMSDIDPEEEYAKIFEVIDVNNNGKLSFAEIKKFMQ